MNAFLKFIADSAELLASLIAIVAGVFAVIKWGRSVIRNTWLWMTRYRPSVPMHKGGRHDFDSRIVVDH